MDSGLVAPLLAGGFGLGGVIGGALLSNHLNRRADDRRLAADDDRRWLNDRRQVYSRYLALSEMLLRRVDAIAVVLSYDGTADVGDDDEEAIAEALVDYFDRWEDELQPALYEVLLMASPHVSDLADRVSVALMELTTEIESRGTFTAYYPGWFQAKDLV